MRRIVIGAQTMLAGCRLPRAPLELVLMSSVLTRRIVVRASVGPTEPPSLSRSCENNTMYSENNE